jgi:hypothetical protein
VVVAAALLGEELVALLLFVAQGKEQVYSIHFCGLGMQDRRESD